MKINLREMEKY